MGDGHSARFRASSISVGAGLQPRRNVGRRYRPCPAKLESLLQGRLVAASVTGGGCWAELQVVICSTDHFCMHEQLPLITDMLALASNHMRCKQHGAMVRWQCTQTQLRATRQTIPTQPAAVRSQRRFSSCQASLVAAWPGPRLQPESIVSLTVCPSSTHHSSIPRLDLSVIGTRPGCFTPPPATAHPPPDRFAFLPSRLSDASSTRPRPRLTAGNA